MPDNNLQPDMPLPVQPEEPQEPRSIPSIQLYLLLFLLVGYPLISILMSLASHSDPAKITSLIKQVYLPSFMIQIIILALVVTVIRRTTITFAAIGLRKDDINWTNLASALIFFAGAWTLIALLQGLVIRYGVLPSKDFFYLLPKTLGQKAFWLLLSLGAAFSEEIAFRGYVITRIRILSGSYLMAAVLSSFAFSLGHLYQGLAGVFLTFIYGLMFSGLFVARKSVLPCVIAHFLQDALVLLTLAKM
jgi:membrane protease YdiL (CAAX protease family)